MPIRKDARLHMEGTKIVTSEGLQPGDLISMLPGLWSHIGLVCTFRSQKHALYFDIEDRRHSIYQNLFPIENDRSTYFVIPGSGIVPLIDSTTFDTSHPGRNGIALMGDKVLCVGWINSSDALFDAKNGDFVDRSTANPLFITSWDILTKDVDDEVVSLLEVRPD